MITLSKSGSTVTFTFDDNSGYLQNGTIDVPVNSLSLILDESNMATFRKSASNDIFVSANLAEFGMSKSELEAWYKANMVGSSGGSGSGGTTPEEVQQMIDESISGKADTSAVTEAISAATDDMATQTWVGEQGYLTEHQSLSAYSTTEEVNTAIEEATSGKADTSAVTAVNNVLTAHTADTTIHVTSADKTAWNAKSDFSGSYNDLTDKPTIPTVPTSNTAFTNDAGYITEDALSGYAESSAVTAEINAATSGKADSTDVQTLSGTVTAHTADTTIHVTSSDKSTWSGKQDALVSGTNIKTINNESILGSGNITISGGSGGNPTVELTQAEYDALVSGGTVDPTTYYIITDATPIDLSGYAQTSAVTESINAATSGLQETLVSGSNIKTINNQSLLGSGNIDIQGGGGGGTYSAGTGIDIDSANTITAVYRGWAGERVQNLEDISTPFYMFKSDDCYYQSTFLVTFYINYIPTLVQFDVSTHTYTFIEGDSSWENYVNIEWDTTFGNFKATPNTSINVTDGSCARFSRLFYSGTTVNAIDGTLDRIESVKNSAIGNLEFGTRDIYNDLYIYPSTLAGGYMSLYTVGLEGGLKVMGSNISTQMQSSPYKWMSGATIGDSETSTFNNPSSAITFNISRNPSEYLYALDANGNGYVFLDSNGDNPSSTDYSVVVDNGSVTVSALSTSKYITKIGDSQGELDQYVSNVQYWGYELDTIPNVVLNINDKLGGLSLVKLSQSAYDALTTKDDNTVYFVGDSTNGYTMKLGSANVN